MFEPLLFILFALSHSNHVKFIWDFNLYYSFTLFAHGHCYLYFVYFILFGLFKVLLVAWDFTLLFIFFHLLIIIQNLVDLKSWSLLFYLFFVRGYFRSRLFARTIIILIHWFYLLVVIQNHVKFAWNSSHYHFYFVDFILFSSYLR